MGFPRGGRERHVRYSDSAAKGASMGRGGTRPRRQRVDFFFPVVVLCWIEADMGCSTIESFMQVV